MSVKAPKIGDIVHFWEDEDSHKSTQPKAAIVAFILQDLTINVAVIGMMGEMIGRVSVGHTSETRYAQWDWPKGR